MRFSVTFPSPDSTTGTADLVDYISLAREVESAGLHAISVTDHPFPRLEPGVPGHQAFDPFVLLTAVGAATRRIRLHFSLLVAPYRNPFLVARALATMGMMYPDRVTAAFGAGYLQDEFEALGADFTDRGTQVEEVLTAILAALEGVPVYAQGRTWRASGNVMAPVPHRGSVKLWRGGNGNRALAYAATKLDGWTPFEIAAPAAALTQSESLDDAAFERRVRRFRELSADRCVAPEICMVRTSRRWLQSAGSVMAELQRLSELGVDWLEIPLLGRTQPERVAHVHRFAGMVDAVGAW